MACKGRLDSIQKNGKKRKEVQSKEINIKGGRGTERIKQLDPLLSLFKMRSLESFRCKKRRAEGLTRVPRKTFGMKRREKTGGDLIKHTP